MCTLAALRYVTLANARQVLAALVGEGQPRREKEGGTKAYTRRTYLREVNVHTFSAQIEYVPVSGVGVNDNLDCRADTTYCTSAAILSTDFFEVRFLNERTYEKRLLSSYVSRA